MENQTKTNSTITSDQLCISADTIDRITELAHASIASQEIGGTTQLLVPEKYKHIDLTIAVEKTQQRPYRKSGTAKLFNIHSFLQYASDQNLSHTGYIYADTQNITLTAVFNDLKDQNLTGWRDHRATFQAEYSREFNLWLNQNKQQKSQEEFAIFLEDNIADIAEPSGESLLSVALTLQAKTEVNFASSKRLDNGQVQLTYSENIDARAGNGNIEIPREFKIGVRVFKNGDGYAIKARLKYRLHAGSVKFWYELDRPENAIETAFEETIQAARASGYTVLLGRP